jgi:hypothetical protein
VKVRIITNGDTLHEEGEAQQTDLGHEWIYTATQDADKMADCKIEIEASDIPNNISIFEQNLS